MTSTATAPYVAGTWTIDPQNSEVGFTVRHLGVAKVRGRLNAVSGEIVTGESIEDSSVTATVDAESVDTGYADRDTYIKGDAVLAAAEHTELCFVSTGVRRADGGYFMDGRLTVRGITKPVSMSIEMNGFGNDPMAGRTVAGMSGELVVDRNEFNLAAKIPSAIISDRIVLNLEVQATLATS